MIAQQPRRWTWALITAALALPAAAQAEYPLGMPLTNGYGAPLSPSLFTIYGPISNVPYRGYGSPYWTSNSVWPLSSPTGYPGVYPYSPPTVSLPTDIYLSVPANQPLYPVYPQNPYASSYPGAYTGYQDLLSSYQASQLRQPSYGKTTALLASVLVAPLAGAPPGGGALPSLTLRAAAFPWPRRPAGVAGTGRADGLVSSATVDVSVPVANAEVWVEGHRMHLTGTFRHFLSPPLKQGRLYAYEIRARWEENGQAISRTRTVEVRAGSTVRVDFAAP